MTASSSPKVLIFGAGSIGRSFIAGLDYFITGPEEQQAIAALLDRKTMRVDRLIEKVQTSIETLRKARPALISVTAAGKVDVRKEVK